MHSTHSVGQANSDGSDNLQCQFDTDDADWYIMQCAFDAGLDPNETLRDVRAAQVVQRASQGGSAGAVPITAPAALQHDADGGLWPPGFAGRIARRIYEGSYSPVHEVAITATLALLAGVCGRTYRTHTGIDLAIYLILVADLGLGKDGIHNGIPEMLRLADTRGSWRFLRAADFVSGPALHGALLDSPGFLNLQGEFGRKLKRMSNPADTPMQQFRDLMTKAYAKHHLEGREFSNAERNQAGVDTPALSFLGETTPGTFLACLTPDMMEDGFLSRFLTVTYTGKKPVPRPGSTFRLDPQELAHWQNLVRQCVKAQDEYLPPCVVEANDDARAVLWNFEIYCNDSFNATDSQSEKMTFARAPLKAMKIACLLAVADNPYQPRVTTVHAAWALNIIELDMQKFRLDRDKGDIGTDDSARERKLVAILQDYLVKAPAASYKIPPAMRENSIIPRNYLQIRIGNKSPAFNNYLGRAGNTVLAIDHTIQSCINQGYLMEVDKLKVAEAYNHHGKAYRIIKLPDYAAMAREKD